MLCHGLECSGLECGGLECGGLKDSDIEIVPSLELKVIPSSSLFYPRIPSLFTSKSYQLTP